MASKTLPQPPAESARVTAIDTYLTMKLDNDDTRRSLALADRFVDTLVERGYSRATLRGLSRGLQ